MNIVASGTNGWASRTAEQAERLGERNIWAIMIVIIKRVNKGWNIWASVIRIVER
jgi:hypothetical protein